MEDRAGGDRCLTAAGGAFIGKRLGIERPGFGALAFWADKVVRSAFFVEMTRACRVVREPRGEGGSRHRTVVFPAGRHESKCRTLVAVVKRLTLPLGGP